MDNHQRMRTFLEELSAKGGGSLVKHVIRSQIDGHTRVLFIGLGGLGCKTVNAIKGVYEQEFVATPYIRFLAVDTCETDMSKLTMGGADAGPDAHLSAAELFSVYSTDAQDLLIHRPPVVKPWLHDDVPPEPISGDGAKGRRVTGRVMLCGTGKYQALRGLISQNIDDLSKGSTAQDKVSVVIVAGISGGTGSGTFVDVSYMARMLLEEKRASSNLAGELYGVFFTPDVQAKIPEIAGDDSIWRSLCRNGYAAMKELDYFVNVGTHTPGSEAVYSIRLPDGTTYSSHTTMFEKSKVFIISASVGARDCETIVQQTASSLMNMFQTGFSDANGSQSVLSTLSNAQNHLQMWVNGNVGLPDTAGQADPCGVKGCKFPRFMNYNFASLGFRSIYFPRNEMVAYCANEAFRRIYAEWHRAFAFTPTDVQTVAEQCGMGSEDQIYQLVRQALGLNAVSFRVKPKEPAYPVRHGTPLVGWVTNLDATMEEAANRVKMHLDAINTNINPVEGVFRQVVGFVEQPNFALNYGPYGGLVLLSGDGSSHSGLCGMLRSFANNMNTVIQSKADALQKARGAMQTASEVMAADRSPHDDEIETFVSACEHFSEAYFEYEFFNRHMNQLVQNLYHMLMNYNNETFEIYVPIMETVKEILEEDATIFARTTLEAHGDRATYSVELNALSMNQANNMGAAFRQLFDGYVDQNMINQVAGAFVQSLFGQKSRQIWANYAADPQALSNEIRRVFNTISKPLIAQMLERFIVLVYCSPADVAKAVGHTGALTLQDVNALWENQVLRTTALQSAARNIVDSLIRSKMISFDIDPGESQMFPKNMTVVLLSETPELNQAIAAVLRNETYGGNPSITTIGDQTTCEYKTAISMAMSVSPFPLAMVSGMRGYAECYFASEHSITTAAGRHLNEVTEQWQVYLPELYGVDAERYFHDRRRVQPIPDASRKELENKPFNNDHSMYEQIRAAVEYGLKNRYIQLGDIHGAYTDYYYLILPKSYDPDLLRRIQEKIKELSTDDAIASFTDALLDIEQNEHEKLYVEYRLDEGMEAETIKSKQTATPANPFELKNLYRLVRCKMESEKRVIDAMEQFQGARGGDFFETLSRLGGYQEVILKFCRAYMLGLISHDDRLGWLCAYSDNPMDPPLEFFNDTYQEFQDELDLPFHWYLVISAFSRIADSEYLEELGTMYKTARKEHRELKSCAEIVAEISAGFQSDIMRMRNVEARAKELAKVLKYSEFYSAKEPEEDYYSFPLPCGGDPNLVIRNLERVLEVLDELQKRKQIS